MRSNVIFSNLLLSSLVLTQTCPIGLGGLDCRLPLCGGRTQKLRMPPEPAAGKCNCDDGWFGVNCNVCTKDVACMTLLPKASDPVCLTSGDITPKLLFKSCDVLLPEFYQKLLGKDRRPGITMECDGARADSEDSEPPAFGCRLQFWLEVEQQFRCETSECFYTRHRGNETMINCAKIACKCLGSDAEMCNAEKLLDVSPILEVVKGPAVLQCAKADECLLIERTLDDYFGQDGGVRMSCKSGTCLDKSEIPRGQKEMDMRVPAALSIFALLLLLIFLFVLLRRMAIIQRALIKTLDSDRNGVILPEDETRLLYESQVPAKVSFSEVSFEYEPGAPVLQAVTGQAEPGKVMAIIGGSGAGKTTLLEILYGRIRKFRGGIWVNSSPMSSEEMQKICGYVEQEDYLTPTLTVKECLLYSAFLRLPPSMSIAAKKLRVEQCMRELGIDHLGDKMVGGSWRVRGLSGGERKRVSIASALLTAPRILFLDEPTTGLDAHSAFKVMEAIIKMARMYQRTVILSIHQPRSNIFAMIDSLLLLGQGRMLYSGDAASAANYFAQLGFTVPPGFNTADYLVDISMDANAEYSQGMLGDQNGFEGLLAESDEEAETHHLLDLSDEVEIERLPWYRRVFSGAATPRRPPNRRNPELQKRLEYFEDEFRRAPLYSGLKGLLPSNRASLTSVGDLLAVQPQKCSRLWQLAILCCRTWTNLKRDPALIKAHYVITIALAVLVGSLFWKVTNDMAGVQNRLGCIFFVCAFFAFSSLTALEAVSSERKILRKEKRDISASMYYVAKLLFDLVPLRLFPPVIFSLIVYRMVGLYPQLTVFFKFVLALTAFNFVTSLFAFSIGIAVESRSVASLMSSLGLLFSLLFGGFLLNKQRMPLFFRWLPKVSFFHYAFESLIVNELAHVVLHDDSIIKIEIPGTIILRQFGFDTEAYWWNLRILLLMGIAFASLGIIALKKSIKN